MDVKKLLNLENKIAVVSGGAGLVGYFISEGLAEAGAKVIVADVNLKKCKEIAKELTNNGLDVEAEELDITDEKSIIELRDKVVSKHRKIDILVNSAVARPMQKFDDPIENWESSMKTNATGIFLCTRIFVDQMVKQKKGNIINISSIYGMVGPDFRIYEGTDMDNPPDYAFHKAGLINFTRYLATRFAKYNIRVNCIIAGGLFNNQPKAFLDKYNCRVPLGRMANGDDIKGAVVYLASDASSYVTGHNLIVDGGWTIW